MKRLLIVAAVALIAAPALAGSDLQLSPVTGAKSATYDQATGQLTPGTPLGTRYGGIIWRSDTDTGWYFGSYQYGWLVLDWGDIQNDSLVNGFQFGFATDLLLPTRITAVICYYADENGYNSNGRTGLMGFIVANLPTGSGAYNAWYITVDIEGSGYEFSISGADLDGDQLADFGYTYWFMYLPAGSATGPMISGDANQLPDAPGMEDSFDGYFDPNYCIGTYNGNWYFGGDPFAQFLMVLYGGANEPYRCPNAGDANRFCTADIAVTPGDPNVYDCKVGLPDLSKLLVNYNTTSGMTADDGDCDPWPTGDGDVDLGDLSELLRQYNDDCN